jgi:hypothetical protein
LYISTLQDSEEYKKCTNEREGWDKGDSLSLFLFDLLADVFHRILRRALNNGFIKWLGNFGTLGQILNLHFDDDTLLFLDATMDNI